MQPSLSTLVQEYSSFNGEKAKIIFNFDSTIQCQRIMTSFDEASSNLSELKHHLPSQETGVPELENLHGLLIELADMREEASNSQYFNRRDLFVLILDVVDESSAACNIVMGAIGKFNMRITSY